MRGSWRSHEAAAGNIGRMGFAGALTLPEIGMVHLRARAYAPNLGRFIQPDPIGTAGGINLYAYAGGDPVNAIDPLGLTPTEPPEDCVPPLCYIWPGNRLPSMPETAGENTFELQKLLIAISPPPTVPTFSEYFPEKNDAPICQNGVGQGCTVRQIVVVTAIAGIGAGPGGTLAITGSRAAFTQLIQSLGLTGIGCNPFAGKNFDEVFEMLLQAGYVPRGDVRSGMGTFVNPRTGRSFHLDFSHALPKGPHIGVTRPRGARTSVPGDTSHTRDYFIGPK
jgi:RHS repeat-associated protein